MRQKQLSRLELGQSAQNLRNPRPRNLAWRYVTGKNFQPYLSNVYQKVMNLLRVTFVCPFAASGSPFLPIHNSPDYLLRPNTSTVTIVH
jgi:hypothetical protein